MRWHECCNICYMINEEQKALNKKTVESFARRIRKAAISFSIGTDMFLQLEIDGMSVEQRVELKSALLARKNSVSYEYLNKKIGNV